MPRYLLTAEADQIQDFIYRASRLREVVGGSQLLSKFCARGAQALLDAHGTPDDRFIVNDGGAFQVVFEDAQAAKALERTVAFGRDLAELYRRCAGGNLTVAHPVAYDGTFQQANQHGQQALRHAKSRGDTPSMPVHVPYLAFCASCGIALARDHTKRHADDTTERSNYVCSDCLHKAAEPTRSYTRRVIGKPRDLGFIDAFRAVVWELPETQSTDYVLDAPQNGDWTEAIEKFDPRRYVAYLFADGNNMGTLFSRCTQEEQMRALSQRIPHVLRQSLAAPCGWLLERIYELRSIPARHKHVLPVLPLIVGGDDLFALLPAPWALDFAARFCCAYEENLEHILKSEAIQLWDAIHPPTIAAAVVVCKANYPYTLAHERGERLLHHAKAFARHLELEEQRHVSTLNFTVITGNEVGSGEPTEDGAYRATLRPYFVRQQPPSDASIPIQHLLEQRLALKDLAGKRRAEFERLYDITEIPRSRTELLRWQRRLTMLLDRVGRSSTAQGGTVSTTRQHLDMALAHLGDARQAQTGYWRSMVHPSSTEFYGHGLPDLLAVWDYALKLDIPSTAYEGQ